MTTTKGAGFYGLVISQEEGEEFVVDWGDGSAPETFVTVFDEDEGKNLVTLSHDYADNSPYDIVATGDMGEVIGLNIEDCALTYLDISQCVNLTTLEGSSNSLTLIDLSSCAALEVVLLSSNALENPDVSPCPVLLVLYLNNNGMSSSEVDAVLVALAAHAIDNGECSMTTNSVPGPDGQAAKTVLEGRGWIVAVDA